MRRSGRHVVAVVLGGRSAGQRDAQMRNLLSAHIMTASTRRTAPAFAEAPADRDEPRSAAMADAEEPAPAPHAKPLMLHKVASGDATASIEFPPPAVPVAPAAQPQPGSTDPIKPLLVKTVSIKPTEKAPRAAKASFTSIPSAPPPPAAASDVSQAQAKVVALLRDETPKPVARSTKKAAPERHVRSGWMIQVGAYEDEKEALSRLKSVQSRAKRLLGRADAFTEPVTKGQKTFYRARFAGLGKDQADAACRTLKRSDIACLSIKN